MPPRDADAAGSQTIVWVAKTQTLLIWDPSVLKSEDRKHLSVCIFSILFSGKSYVVLLMILGSGYVYTCSWLIQQIHNILLRMWSERD